MAILFGAAWAQTPDTLAQRLDAARATLTEGARAEAGSEALALLVEARDRADLADHVYPLAADLTQWALARYQFDVALSAAQSASATAPDVISRGRALTYEGEALLFLRHEGEAIEVFRRALAVLDDYAVEIAGETLPEGQRAYAELIVAWRAAVAIQHSRGARFDPPPSIIQTLPDRPPRCEMYVDQNPPPTYPRQEYYIRRVGAVMARLRIDEAGAVIGSEIVAVVPSQRFADAVSRVMRRWRVARGENSAPGCRMQTDMLFVPVTFAIPVRD